MGADPDISLLVIDGSQRAALRLIDPVVPVAMMPLA
jgi:hypothetical protein